LDAQYARDLKTILKVQYAKRGMKMFEREVGLLQQLTRSGSTNFSKYVAKIIDVWCLENTKKTNGYRALETPTRGTSLRI